MHQIVNDDNNDTKGVLVNSLSIATTSSMALCALYVSSANTYYINYLFLIAFYNCRPICKKYIITFFLLSYNVSAKCKLSETNLLNGILLLCNSDNNIKKSKQSRCGQQALESI